MRKTRRARGGAVASLRRFTRQAVAIAALAGCLLLAAAFVGVSAPANALARDRGALQADIARYEARIAAQKAELEHRQTDAYVVERASDYGYVRPGEALIVVDGIERRASDARSDARSPGRLAKWLAVFFR